MNFLSHTWLWRKSSVRTAASQSLFEYPFPAWESACLEFYCQSLIYFEKGVEFARMVEGEIADKEAVEEFFDLYKN